MTASMFALRPSKYVDRRLFADLLRRLDRLEPMSAYVYVGMGGATLEDHRLLWQELGMTKLVSLETNQTVYLRQVFNRPVESIRCLLASAESFAGDQAGALKRLGYLENEKRVVWFDFTKPKELGSQLDQFQTLVNGLWFGDVARLTVNVSPANWGDGSAPGDEVATGLEARRKAQRLQNLRESLGERLPNDVGPDDMITARFPKLVCRMIQEAVEEALSSTPDRTFVPLSIMQYRDGQSMLSVTGIVSPPVEAKQILATTGLDDWPFLCREWGDIHNIAVPDITLRERLLLDQGSDGPGVEVLPYALDTDQEAIDKDKLNTETLLKYQRYRRFMPQFMHVSY